MTTLDDEYAKFKKLAEAEKTAWELLDYEEKRRGIRDLDENVEHVLRRHKIRAEWEETTRKLRLEAPAMMAFIDTLMARLEVARGALEIARLYPIRYPQEGAVKVIQAIDQARAALDAPLEKKKEE